jgi:hypothetical protein
MNMSVVIPGLTGLTVFTVLQIFFSLTWDRLFAWAKVTQPSWLSSTRSVVVTLLVVFLTTTVLFGITKIALLRGSMAMIGGLAVGMTIALLVQGPGNLWPIALVVGYVLLSVPVALGALAATGLRWALCSREV